MSPGPGTGGKVTEADRKQLLNTLATLGGRANKDSDIVFEGTRLVIPERMDLQDAQKFLEKRIEEDERPTQFVRDFLYRPWDGAHATYQVLSDLFGMVGMVAQQGLFGQEYPPTRITINLSATERTDVPWGDITVPFLERTTLTTDQVRHPEYGSIFRLIVEGPRKYRYEVEGIFAAIEVKLREASIYKSKAFDGQEMPEFLDLSKVDPSKVSYAEDVNEQLDASVWSLLRYTDANEALGLPLKRAVLLAGPYGTGKTLAAMTTAKIATENGWAFLYVRPGRDNFASAFQTARLYQPAVLFFEDAENVASAGDGISEVLDLFDGIQAKNTRLMVVMTTNHPDKIHKGMMRPGRLDAVIHIGALDGAGIERLVRAVVPAGSLGDVDFGQVAEAMDGYMPAFVKEATDRAVRYSLVRQGGVTTGITITTEDLVGAAKGLRPQFEAMCGAPEAHGKDAISENLGALVRQTVASLVPDPDATSVRRDVWDPKALAEAQNGSK